MDGNFGERLRKERERLGLNQAEFASVGGVNRNSQGSYERSRQAPDVRYLLAVAELGIDVNYVLFGTRRIASEDLTSDEAELIRLAKSLPCSDQTMIIRIIRGLLNEFPS